MSRRVPKVGKRSTAGIVVAGVIGLTLFGLSNNDIGQFQWDRRYHHSPLHNITDASSSPINEVWTRYSSNIVSNITSSQPSHDDQQQCKVLIAQYAGTGNDYLRMLQLSLRSSHAYARRWKWDVLEVQGILMPTWRRNPSEATYNKVAILSRLVDDAYYDYVLLLDADAVVIDHAINIVQWFQTERNMSSHVLFAQRVVGRRRGVHQPWNVNIGVTLWNLRNPIIESILRKWKFRVKRRQWLGRPNDDQRPLQEIFKHMTNTDEVVYADSSGIFSGKVIRHFIRASSNQWNENGSINIRLQQIQQAVDDVCQGNEYCE